MKKGVLRFLPLAPLIIVNFLAGCEATHSSLGIRNNTPRSVSSISSNIGKIVVLANKGDYRDYIENFFTETLVNKGYNVASRRDLPAVYQEITLQQSGNTAGEVARFGQILRSDAVLVVEITELTKRKTDKGNSYVARASISARLVDVETSKIIWMCSKSYNPSLLETIIEIPVGILVMGEDEIAAISYSIMKDFPNR